MHKEVGSVRKAAAKLFGPKVLWARPTVHDVDAVFYPPSVFGAIGSPIIPVGLAHFQGGGVVQKNTVQNVGDTGIANLKLGCKEANVCTLFKICVNAVKNTAAVAADDRKAFFFAFTNNSSYAIGILAKTCVNRECDGESAGACYRNAFFL